MPPRFTLTTAVILLPEYFWIENRVVATRLLSVVALLFLCLERQGTKNEKFSHLKRGRKKLPMNETAAVQLHLAGLLRRCKSLCDAAAATHFDTVADLVHNCARPPLLDLAVCRPLSGMIVPPPTPNALQLVRGTWGRVLPHEADSDASSQRILQRCSPLLSVVESQQSKDELDLDAARPALLVAHPPAASRPKAASRSSRLRQSRVGFGRGTTPLSADDGTTCCSPPSALTAVDDALYFVCDVFWMCVLHLASRLRRRLIGTHFLPLGGDIGGLDDRVHLPLLDTTFVAATTQTPSPSVGADSLVRTTEDGVSRVLDHFGVRCSSESARYVGTLAQQAGVSADVATGDGSFSTLFQGMSLRDLPSVDMDAYEDAFATRASRFFCKIAAIHCHFDDALLTFFLSHVRTVVCQLITVVADGPYCQADLFAASRRASGTGTITGNPRRSELADDVMHLLVGRFAVVRHGSGTLIRAAATPGRSPSGRKSTTSANPATLDLPAPRQNSARDVWAPLDLPSVVPSAGINRSSSATVALSPRAATSRRVVVPGTVISGTFHRYPPWFTSATIALVEGHDRPISSSSAGHGAEREGHVHRSRSPTAAAAIDVSSARSENHHPVPLAAHGRASLAYEARVELLRAKRDRASLKYFTLVSPAITQCVGPPSHSTAVSGAAGNGNRVNKGGREDDSCSPRSSSPPSTSMAGKSGYSNPITSLLTLQMQASIARANAAVRESLTVPPRSDMVASRSGGGQAATRHLRQERLQLESHNRGAETAVMAALRTQSLRALACLGAVTRVEPLLSHGDTECLRLRAAALSEAASSTRQAEGRASHVENLDTYDNVNAAVNLIKQRQEALTAVLLSSDARFITRDGSVVARDISAACVGVLSRAKRLAATLKAEASSSAWNSRNVL